MHHAWTEVDSYTDVCNPGSDQIAHHPNYSALYFFISLMLLAYMPHGIEIETLGEFMGSRNLTLEGDILNDYYIS